MEPTTKEPTVYPTAPTSLPTKQPTSNPTTTPTKEPTAIPSLSPSAAPTVPTIDPTAEPTHHPSKKAELTLHCDNAAIIYLSHDGKASWTNVGNTTAWFRAFNYEVTSISADTVVHVSCRDTGMVAGLIATMHYNGQNYSTTEPLSESVWDLVNSTDGVTSPFVYSNKTASTWSISTPGIASDAKWVWNRNTYNTMLFEFAFDGLVTTATPTTLPTGDPTMEPTVYPTAPTSLPTKGPTAGIVRINPFYIFCKIQIQKLCCYIFVISMNIIYSANNTISHCHSILSTNTGYQWQSYSLLDVR